MKGLILPYGESGNGALRLLLRLTDFLESDLDQPEVHDPGRQKPSVSTHGHIILTSFPNLMLHPVP